MNDDLRSTTQRAIRLAGGMKLVAADRGITRQAVWRWANVTGKIPAEHVAALSRLSGIPMKELRPDVEWAI